MDQSVKDELQVRRLLADYSDAVWRLDADAYGATWADDGEWRVLGNTPKGRAAVVAFWQQFMSNFRSAWQICHTALLDVAGETGTGRVYINEIVTALDGSTSVSMGIYHDDYVKVDGRWLFARRHFDLIYAGPPDFSGFFHQTIPFGPGSKDPAPGRAPTPSMADLGM